MYSIKFFFKLTKLSTSELGIDIKYADLVDQLKILSNRKNKITFLLDPKGLKYNVSSLSTFAKELRSGKLSKKYEKIEIRLNNEIRDGNLYDDVSNNEIIYPVTEFSSPGIEVNENYQNRIYQTPTTINLEITEGCNFRCNHCYNPWREVSQGINSLSKNQCDFLIEEFQKCGIFHVVLSGGEPFSNFETLCYMLSKLTENNITSSINSNLSLATPDKIKRLKDLGLDHILTSWYSDNNETTASITNIDKAQDLVINGIKTAVNEGIRVSVNSILTQYNKDALYQSGKIVAELGAFQFLAYRAVPPVHERGKVSEGISLSKEDALYGLDVLLRLKKEYGIQVGTLIGYPLCLMSDLNKYSDFIGRGCPSQQGYRFAIHPDGSTHSCVMEDVDYGNVFKNGIKKAFSVNSKNWMDGSYLYEACKSCSYVEICGSGCRMDALARTGVMDGADPFYSGEDNIKVPLKFIPDDKFVLSLKGKTFRPKKDLRFRQENGFGLINIRWSNIIEADQDLFELIKNAAENDLNIEYNQLLKIKRMSLEYLSGLLNKEVITLVEESDSRNVLPPKKGVSIDPATIPNIFKTHITHQ